MPTARPIDLKLPNGLEEGTKIRLAGKGQHGPAGPGDGIVTIAIGPHAFFGRDGNDIRLDLPVTLREAVLGAKVKVPTPDGPVMLTVPKGSTSGKVLRIKGRGFTDRNGRRGDQLVTLEVDLPSGDRELEAFAERWNGPGNPRPPSGFEAAQDQCRTIAHSRPRNVAKRLASFIAAFGRDVAEKLRPGTYPFEVLKRVGIGVYNDGFIHAGNLAYLALLTLFPFFILAAALASLFGETESSRLTVATVLSQLPPGVADVLRKPVQDVLTARTGPLLWVGALVGLWTVGSFIETIRDILRRAYGVKYCAPFWEYRLGSMIIIVGAVLLLMIAFAVTVVLRSAQSAVEAWIPLAQDISTLLGVFRVVPGLTLFATIYLIFFLLTPSRYRRSTCRIWPGALLITVWWMGTVELLPATISWVGGYALTYGSLAGVMIALIFFFIIGLGVVTGAELNAALADVSPTALKGEIYSGPYKDQLEVEEPQPGEDVELVPEPGGPQL